MVKRKAEAAEEEAFPRGRPSSGPGQTGPGPESDCAGDRAPKAAAGHAPKARRRRDGDGEGRDGNDEDAEDGAGAVALASPGLASEAPQNAPRLRHTDLVEGAMVVAAVREANDDEVTLNLPCNLLGYCIKAQAIEPGSATGPLPRLSDLYQPGQLVVAVVTAVVEVGLAKKQRTEVSLRPSLANAGLDIEGLAPHMWLPAVVQGEEEHVFRLGLGVPGIQGLLKKSDVKGLAFKPCPGVILQVALQSVNLQAGSVRCTTASTQSLGHDALKLDMLKAGFLVHAKVDKVLPKIARHSKLTPDHANAGLVVSFCGGSLAGTIHVHHQGQGAGEDLAIKAKQRVTARVLAVLPGPPVSVHLTLLPHLLDWSAQTQLGSTVSIGDRLDGEVVDSLPKYGSRVRCVQAAAGPPFLAFCPANRYADKDAESAPEPPNVGEKMQCRALAFNYLEGVALVTRRPGDLRNDTLISVSELAPGQLVVGTIKRVTDYGMFLQLSEFVTGLVHLKQLTDVPLTAVPKKFQVGAKAKCRVLRVNPAKRQVSLTAKKTFVKDAFQLTSFDQARKDMLVTGYVSNVQPYGVFVTFYGDTFGLIPSKEVEADDESLVIGMTVQCRIALVNRKRQRLGLSLDLENGFAPAEGEDPTEGASARVAQGPRGGSGEDDLEPGSSVRGIRVVRCIQEGVLLRFAKRKSAAAAEGAARPPSLGFVPVAHLADDLGLAKLQHAAFAAELGGIFAALVGEEEVEDDASTKKSLKVSEEAIVLAPSFNPRRSSAKDGNKDLQWFVLLSLKPSLRLAAAEGAFVSSVSDLQDSRLYNGYIKEVHDFGALVSVGAWKVSGLAPRHQIAQHYVNQPSEELSPGQTVRVLVSKIDIEKKHFNADLRPAPTRPADAALLRREAETLRLFFEASQTLSKSNSWPSGLLPGVVLDGKVNALKPYGMLLSLERHEGLSAVALKESIPLELSKMNVGDPVSCSVLDFDPESGILDVSLQPELCVTGGALLGLAPSEAKKKKRSKEGGDVESGMMKVTGSGVAGLRESQEVLALPVLQKPAYSVLWTREPPAVLFTPPFGERRWTGSPRPVILHSVPDPSASPARVLATCPQGGAEPRNKAKVPKILRPEEELQIGSPVTMRVQSVKGLQILCNAPVGLRGHVHATQFTDLNEDTGAGSGGELPLKDIGKRKILEGRVLQLQQRGEGRRGKIWHLELTCRPSLMAAQDMGQYESAVERWSSLKRGKLVLGAVSEVKRDFVWLEVAPGIRGRVGVLDASLEPSVMRALPDHFQVGQVLQAQVLRAVSAQKKLDLTLLSGVSGPTIAKGCRTLARLEKVEDIMGKGVAATFRLAGRRRGFVHITELFDFWAQFPLKRLNQGMVYEAVVVSDTADKEADAKVQLSLRASKVHGRKEGPGEIRPLRASQVQVGQHVSGYVVNSNTKGVFLALSRSLVGRIRLKALSDRMVMKDAVAKMHPPGELLRDAKVVEVDSESGRVELSLRKTETGGQLTIEQLSVGDVVAGRVKAVEKYGLFVRLDNSNIDGLVHKSEVSDSASVSLASYPKGAPVPLAKVLKIEKQKVWLGMKASLFTEDELEGVEQGQEDDDNDDEEDEVDAQPEEEAPRDADPEVEGAEETQKKRKRGAKPAAPSAAAADSDDEAPWDKAARAAVQDLTASKEDAGVRVRGTGSDQALAGGEAANVLAGFEWAEFKVDNEGASEDGDAEEEASEEDGAQEGEKRPSKRQKKAQKAAEAKELQEREARNAAGRWANDPQSVDDFERLLLTQGDTSIVWIRYMAFHLKMSDLVRARQVAERAVKHIGFSDAKERFNVWVAYMNLECTFGTEDTAEKVFRRAASHNTAKHVHLQLAKIHQRNKKPQLAAKAYEQCYKKFPQSKKVWLGFLSFLYSEGDLEGARKTLPKSLAVLPRRKHPLVVSKAALLEYEHGSAERGRSVFEGLLDSYPKRTDLWSVYLDAHIAAYTPPKASEPDLQEPRALLERCCTMSLKAVKMRFFFKRWLDFEKRWGDAETQERVRVRAREFVEGQAA